MRDSVSDIYADYDHLELEHDRGWLTVWFNEPERRNPLTGARCAELTDLAQWLPSAQGIRGVTLRGRGGIFCAGGDLKAFKSMANTSDEELARTSESIAMLLDTVAAVPQFTVCVVEGAAVAGGVGLACACDRVILMNDARLSLSEVRIGLVAAQIAPFVMARIGAARTRDLMLLGRWIDGAGAVATGLADDVCAADELADRLARIRADLSKTSPQAVAQTKLLLSDLGGMERAAQISRATEVFVRAARSEDGREGLASFLEKRPARWTEEPC